MDNQQMMMWAGLALIILAIYYFTKESYSPNGYSSAFAPYL